MKNELVNNAFKKDIESLKVKVEHLENVRRHTSSNLNRSELWKSCKLFDEKCSLNSDLEDHMSKKHEASKQFKCDDCGKYFHLMWRLRKHQLIHNTGEREVLKYCHYFNNGKECPYEEIGCQFLHLESSKCHFLICSNDLCQFTQYVVVDENHDDEEDESFHLNPNQCHLCKKNV